MISELFRQKEKEDSKMPEAIGKNTIEVQTSLIRDSHCNVETRYVIPDLRHKEFRCMD